MAAAIVRTNSMNYLCGFYYNSASDDVAVGICCCKCLDICTCMGYILHLVQIWVVLLLVSQYMKYSRQVRQLII